MTAQPTDFSPSEVNEGRRRLLESLETGFPIFIRTPLFEVTLTQIHMAIVAWALMLGMALGVGGVWVLDWVQYTQGLEQQIKEQVQR